MTSIQGPGGTSIYLQQNGANVQYSYNLSSWTTISAYPLIVANSNTAAGTLTILITTDLTLTGGTDRYIYVNSTNIQIGSISLNADGSRPTITISDIVNYPGFVANGFSSTNGFNDVSIYNIIVSPSGTTTLGVDNGWVTRNSYARGATNNLIVNCTSTGAIPGGGGICGGFTAGNGGQLTIRNCNSTGAIGGTSGGIVGYNSGQNAGSSITCENCSSTGVIASSGGGIFGSSCGINSGQCTATNCYSTGNIATGAGGIFGLNAGDSSGSASAIRCYSSGTISGGGIFGNSAATSGSASANNCYSSGAITGGSGIFGSGAGTITQTNCYAANNSWSDSTANGSLVGGPTSSPVGSVWARLGSINTPYIFASNGGYSPYTGSTTTTTSESITAGESSSAPVVSGYTYTLLSINNEDPTNYAAYITVGSTTGILTTTTSTPGAIYTILVYSSINPYVITTYTLTVSAAPAPTADSGTTAEGVSCCAIPMDIGTDVDYETRNKFATGNTMIGGIQNRQPYASYTMLLYKQMAFAAKR